LNVVYLPLPPLRQRPEDLRPLVDHFIKKYAGEYRLEQPVTGVDREVERMLHDYTWPGNVRELENVIERAMILCQGPTIAVADLPAEFRQSADNVLFLEGIPADAKLNETLAMIEKKMVERALKMSDNVQSQAAELLGIGKSGLNWKIKKFKLDLGQKD
jgi:two-component system NtrC family response regulator